MNNKPTVLLILEGTYPFNGGGVSTWANMLCNEVNNVDYILYSINANHEVNSKYELGNNIQKVIQVPLWSPLEPQEIMSYGKKYHQFVTLKDQSDSTDIETIFLPLFENLIKNIYLINSDLETFSETLYLMWKYFESHDYKNTLRSKIVWKTYCELISEIGIEEGEEPITLYDLTVGMRWMYRFLIPLSIEVPKASISHLTISGFPIIPALVLKYKYGTPIIATEHGVFIRERLLAISTSEYSFFLKKLLIKLSECITRLVYFKADLILSVNKFNISWEKLYGANPNKIEIIYNGIDHLLFAPVPKPKHLIGIPTVVAAARIFELKDIITMINSCYEVKKVIPNVLFLVYGDKTAVPEYTEECEQLIEKLDLKVNFSLAGFHEQPSLLFSEGDISVLTSISEGFPYTVIESMSCGIPVVATDVGGVSEALDEKSGFICKPKDAVEIGKCIVKLLQNDNLRIEMGRYARQKVISNFSIRKFINCYEQAYEKVLNPIEITIKEPYILEVEEHQEAS